jgi:hypothetical protein
LDCYPIIIEKALPLIADFALPFGEVSSKGGAFDFKTKPANPTPVLPHIQDGSFV